MWLHGYVFPTCTPHNLKIIPMCRCPWQMRMVLHVLLLVQQCESQQRSREWGSSLVRQRQWTKAISATQHVFMDVRWTFFAPYVANSEVVAMAPKWFSVLCTMNRRTRVQFLDMANTSREWYLNESQAPPFTNPRWRAWWVFEERQWESGEAFTQQWDW